MSTATATNPFQLKVPPPGEGGDYDLCPAANHPGVMIGLIDLGHHEDEYRGKVKVSRQVALVFELTAEHKPNGETFVLAKQFTLAFNEKANLRKFVEGWRGKKFDADEEFDLTVLVDRPCLVNVVHRKSKAGDKTYHEIAGVSAVPRGMSVPARSHDPIFYVCEPGSTPPEADWLPFLYGEPMADVIRRSFEFKGRPIPAPAAAAGGNGEAADDDIPF